ncbi:hypothetical protein H9Q10_09285 [Eikenella sp. S3360]|uniref:DUF1963 domain-containing protein n=1 Tax=Eikenella glucosivorans TaxID=2766967 RepID=A0ABS0NC27_9NEIS|nr:hypothetical protein [Eikenella glucosivorans]MBH5329857.1 hypothetical protein [Eikenella glucosivorans]
MYIAPEFIRPFPLPEDVFSADIERHTQFFLPICSLNLRFIQPENGDYWVHFVQPADIYEGSIGENTQPFHSRYNFEDSICFDVDANGKYRFSGDWRFFDAETEIPAEVTAKAREKMEKYQISWQRALPQPYRMIDFDGIRCAREHNHQIYRLIKAFYLKHSKLPLSLYGWEKAVADTGNLQAALAAFEQFDRENEQEYVRHNMPAPYQTELLQDAGGLSPDFQTWMQEDGVSNVHELMQHGFGNLSDPPLRDDGRVFDYIGWLDGNRFQDSGCDELFLFFDRHSRKAVIRLVYS